MTGYCTECQNTGTVDCYCGGDMCLCGEQEIDCPVCGENHKVNVPYECETGDGV